MTLQPADTTVGNLFFETYTNEDPVALSTKILDCAALFEQKHGRWPNQALVHANGVPPQEGWLTVEGIRVDVSNLVIKNHLQLFWNPKLNIPRSQPRTAALRDAAPAEQKIIVPGAAAPQPGLHAGHEIQAPGGPLPIGRNLAALVAAEQRPAPTLALPAPSVPLLPAPSRTLKVIQTEEREELRRILNNIKATRQEFITVMQMYDAAGFVYISRRTVNLAGIPASLRNTHTEGFRATIRYLENVLEERKRRDQRHRRTADLFARFQLEYEQLHPPLRDYILPTGQVVKRPPVIALPGVIGEAAAQEAAAVEQGARDAAPSLAGPRGGPAEEPARPAARDQIARWHMVISLREIGNYVKRFESDTGHRPDEIRVAPALWEKLGKPDNWQGTPIRALDQEHKNNRSKCQIVKWLAAATPTPARPAATAADPARVAGL